MSGSTARRRARMHRDLVKERHTTHWDLDSLSRAELERVYREGRVQRRIEKRRNYLIITLLLMLLCLYPTLFASLGRLFGD